MGLSGWEILVVLVIVVIIFGAGKLPRVMGDVAKGIKNFKSGMRDEGSTDDVPTNTVYDKKKSTDANADL